MKYITKIIISVFGSFILAVFVLAFEDKYILPQDIKVNLIRQPGVVSAATNFKLIPKDLQKAVIEVEVLKGDKTFVLENLKLKLIADPLSNNPERQKGKIVRDINLPNKWIYYPAKELKTEKHPRTLKIKIVPKCSGKICGLSSTITVRSVFEHLVNIHPDNPKGKFHKPYESDYELAWKYARWKYDVDTSNLNEILFDPEMKYKGVTYVAIFSKKRMCKLGRDAFISENICASVLGHENVHGGQSLKMFFGGREKAEPPAYQWELKNAARLGLPSGYVEEIKNWRNAYSEQNRGFKIRLIPFL
jgi:hypothetical protein